MTAAERKTQLRVGIFMALGLAVVGLMVAYFGRFGDSFRGYYTIRVEFSNASGLLKGAGVLLAGAKIGLVENTPTILPNMEGVYVDLKIYEEVKIPSASEFTIGSSGLLGDRFIQINLKKDALKSAPIQPSAVIKGKGEAGGLNDLFEQAGPVIAEVREAVANINSISQKLDNDVFKESTIKDLNATMANLQTTSASFADASKKLDGVIQQAQSAIKTGEQTMVSAKGAADELKKTITDIRSLVQDTKRGKGTIGMLLVDREMAENIRALVVNLRRNGILFYKDRAAETAPRR
jgi:phospholipid/cholesterol/gamma-HCH transport system substrate-binding protein